MQGMGAIDAEPHEPAFHAAWEGRVYALMRVLRARGGRWNTDAFRRGIERLPPADYLRMTYYERWLTWMTATLAATGDATEAEIDTGRPAPGLPRATPFVTAAAAPAMAASRASARRDVAVSPRFMAGERVQARNIHPTGHTRLPRYARGKTGVIACDRGVFVFPDTNAELLGEKPQHLYSVRFAARELWGDGAPPRDAVHLDLWDDYLDPA